VQELEQLKHQENVNLGEGALSDTVAGSIVHTSTTPEGADALLPAGVNSAQTNGRTPYVRCRGGRPRTAQVPEANPNVGEGGKQQF
jgi:hypothetical protein